ncbi:hypothetical protein PM082_024302 [Marasmius tenuissimus]|nr:hypothetical protein PM082_024302 [Marasmius tenuissimus]
MVELGLIIPEVKNISLLMGQERGVGVISGDILISLNLSVSGIPEQDYNVGLSTKTERSTPGSPGDDKEMAMQGPKSSPDGETCNIAVGLL